MMSSAIQPPAPRFATYFSPAVGAPGRGSADGERERFAIRGGLARVRHIAVQHRTGTPLLTGGVTSS